MGTKTGLLVSVRSADEVAAALAGGADLIDVKEPSKGSLAPAEAEVVAAVIEAVGGKVPVNNLGAKLSADKLRFETSEHGWWYRGEPIPLGYQDDFEDSENEKGPEAFGPEPSHMNGLDASAGH